MTLEYDHITNQLYDVLVYNESWDQVLSLLTRALDSEGCYALLVKPGTSETLQGDTFNLNPLLSAEYETETASFCPRIAYANSHREFGILYDYLHTQEEEIDRHPWYDWLSTHGLRYYLNIQTFNNDDVVGGLSFQRTRRQGHPSPEQIALAWKLHPHIRTVMQASLILGEINLRTQAAEQALDQMQVGVLFLDGASRILHMNRPAEQLIGMADGLHTVRRRLAAHNADDDRALRAALRRAAAPWPRGRDDDIAAMLSVSRPSRKAPYQMLVCPISEECKVLALLRPAAIVFIVDPERAPGNAVQTLMRLYGLTEAEAAMAVDLLAGHSLADHAARRQLTLNTARWRLKQIQAKTDTNSQMELMRVLMNGLSGFLRDRIGDL